MKRVILAFLGIFLFFEIEAKALPGITVRYDGPNDASGNGITVMFNCGDGDTGIASSNLKQGETVNVNCDNPSSSASLIWCCRNDGYGCAGGGVSLQYDNTASGFFALQSCDSTNGVKTSDTSDSDDADSDCDHNCSSCSGMPQWSVSEPFISLWLKDEPLGYQPALGNRISCSIAFNQRNAISGYSPNVFNIGLKWTLSWSSCLTLNSLGNIVAASNNGRQTTYYSNVDYLSNDELSGNTNTGFIILHPDGSKDVYGYIATNSSGGFISAYLTQQVNPQGIATVYNYSIYSPTTQTVRLQNVVDGDGKTNSIYYTNNPYSTNLISSVVDPFGRTCYFTYDGAGHLTNITDVAGLSSGIAYDGNNWPTSMTTPYGTTSFHLVDTVAGNFPPNGRSALITQPDGGQNLYLYTNYAPGVSGFYATNVIPQTSPFTNSFDNTNLDSQNTFYWGPRQYGNLSTTTITSFSADDYRKARMKHWLSFQNPISQTFAGQTMSLKRDPSPDAAGTIEGEKTWYDYAGKTNVAYEGTQVEPLLIAWVLPDGTSAFQFMNRNSIGNVLTNISTYTSNNIVALRTNIFVYDAAGIDLLSWQNALGVLVSSNIYNSYHEVATNYDALNEMTVYTFNTNQQPVSILWPTGLTMTNIYGTNNFPATNYSYANVYVGGALIYTQYFGTNTFFYSNDLVSAQTDPRGLVLSNTWDNLQHLIKISFPDGTYVTNAYSKLDLVMTLDRLGFSNAYAYDSMRRKTNVTDALGRSTQYVYCTCGSLESTIDALGYATYFSYDNQGKKTNSLFADGYSVTMNYDLLGRVTNSFDSAGRSATNWFNNQGLVFAVSNYFGRFNYTTFDIIDRATNNVDANGVVTTNAYDTLNRLVLRAYPDGGTELFFWTNTGLIYYTNQLSEVTACGYDAARRKTAETNANLEITRYGYDPASDLLTLTDGKSQTTTWTYDIFGLVSNKLDAASNLILQYHYDADYRLTNRWSAAKGNTYYSYDRVGNLTNINYPVNPAISIAYDALNRPTNMVDAVGTTSYGYDAVGQLLSEDGPWASDTVAYAYTARIRTSLSLQQPNADPWNQTYGCDGARRLTSTASPAGSFGYAYDPNRKLRVSDLSLPNTANITNAYDANARLLGTALVNSGGTNLDAYTYTYNVGNQRTTVTRTLGDVVSYGYDGISQLTSASAKELGGVTNRLQEQFGYGYDAAHNLEFRTNNALIQTFNVNSLNELTTVTRNSTNALTVTGTTGAKATSVTVNGLFASTYNDSTFAEGGFTPVDGNNTYTAIAQDALGRQSTNSVTVFLPASATYSYDLNGNLLSDGTRGFNYDDENQLTNVLVTNAWMSQFVYDGRLRRRIRKEFAWQGGAWVETNEVHYVYDGILVIQERDINNLPVTSYTLGNDLSGSLQGAGGVGGMLAMSQLSNARAQHFYYHADGIGNITELVNSIQSIAAKYLYDPFGNNLSLSGLMAYVNTYRSFSKEYHHNSGLLSYLYRLYDPHLQKWLNRDPIEEFGGFNLYVYNHNNGISFSDAFGLLTAVIIGGPSPSSPGNSSGNPFGHAAIAITGEGVYSFGTGTVPGSDLTAYLDTQATYRDSKVYILNTTPEQEQKILQYLKSQVGRTMNNYPDNCAHRTSGALNAGGVTPPGLQLPLADDMNIYPFHDPNLPSGIGGALDDVNTLSIPVPKGSVLPPNFLTGFNQQVTFTPDYTVK